jgi:WhiB family redox-sensing transcriptional regulator
MTARQRRASLRGSLPWGGQPSPLLALADLLKAVEWHDRALCGQVGGDAWFPDRGQPIPEAKEICAHCPVADECLEDALEHHDQDGIWGGFNLEERNEIRRQRTEVAA